MNTPDGIATTRLRRRRRRRWVITGLFVLGVPAALISLVWWTFATNQLGAQISRIWRNRLPGELQVGAVVVESAERLVLKDVVLRENSQAVPLLTVERIEVDGALWHGKVERIHIGKAHGELTADNLRFLHRVIDKETDIPPDGPPKLRHLDIDGFATIDGEPFGSDVSVSLDVIGPAATGSGHMQLDGRTFALSFAAEGSGDDLHHRFTVDSATGTLSVHALCRRLATLRLLPAIPDGALPWIPDVVNLGGTAVVANRRWREFTGTPRVAWPEGSISATMTLDRRQLRLDQVRIAAPDGIGTLDGVVGVGFGQDVEVRAEAFAWHPGPIVPLPAAVPVDGILTAMPQAIFTAVHSRDLWTLELRMAGNGTGAPQTQLSWSPGQPLRIDGTNLPLSLLQPFLPSGVDLAAGRAARLGVAVSKQLESLHAEVEQTRVLWNGWALGPVDAVVDAHPADSGLDLSVQLMNLQAEQRKKLAIIGWRGSSVGGELNTRVEDLEVLMTRLKGPSALPELRGALNATTIIDTRGAGVHCRLKDTHITGGVLAFTDERTVRDVVQRLDADLEGTCTIANRILDAKLGGRIIRGEVHFTGSAIDIAKRKPIFTADLHAEASSITLENLLLRATNDQGQPQPDGFSAGLDATLSTGPLRGTITGAVDHADLGWIASLLPPVQRRLRGEGAVTFTAQLGRGGVERVEGWFLPLDATLDLGTAFRANGLSGAVQFLLARDAGK